MFGLWPYHISLAFVRKHFFCVSQTEAIHSIQRYALLLLFLYFFFSHWHQYMHTYLHICIIHYHLISSHLIHRICNKCHWLKNTIEKAKRHLIYVRPQTKETSLTKGVENSRLLTRIYGDNSFHLLFLTKKDFFFYNGHSWSVFSVDGIFMVSLLLLYTLTYTPLMNTKPNTKYKIDYWEIERNVVLPNSMRIQKIAQSHTYTNCCKMLFI